MRARSAAPDCHYYTAVRDRRTGGLAILSVAANSPAAATTPAGLLRVRQRRPTQPLPAGVGYPHLQPYTSSKTRLSRGSRR